MTWIDKGNAYVQRESLNVTGENSEAAAIIGGLIHELVVLGGVVDAVTDAIGEQGIVDGQKVKSILESARP